MSYLDVYDTNYNTNNAKIFLKSNNAIASARYDKQLDFSAVPIEFLGAIQLYQVGLWGAGDYCTITFYGWEEVF